MTTLLDCSVAVALLADDHEHHQAARRWFHVHRGRFATCPITQGAVVRYALRRGRSAASALQSVGTLAGNERHEFWSDDVEYTQVRFDGIVGHRQVSDAYLAELARRRAGRLATLDGPLADLHSDVAELVPTA